MYKTSSGILIEASGGMKKVMLLPFLFLCVCVPKNDLQKDKQLEMQDDYYIAPEDKADQNSDKNRSNLFMLIL